MATAVTDLFVQGSAGLTDETIALFDDVISRLVVRIEVSARALLAQRLAPIRNAPLNITRTLASDDEIRVAQPILTQSERLDDATLAQIARSKTQEHLLAISGRKSVSAVITDVLVARGNGEVVLNVAKNPGARFSEAGYSRLVRRSEGDDNLAAYVGSRPDIPHALFLALLATASDLVRSKLIAENLHSEHDIYRVVTKVAADVRKEAEAISKNNAGTAASAESPGALDQLNDEEIRSFVERKQFQQVAAALARICNMPLRIVERAIMQDQPETLLIIAKVAKLSIATIKTLLSLRPRQRHSSSQEIEESLASFKRLNFGTAQQIVEFYRTRQTNKASRPH